jgi:hypothetical protein
MRRALLFWLCWSMATAGYADETVALHCARGNVPDYPDARLLLTADGPHAVHVTFVGYRPSAVRADWSLRDCLQTAIKYDGSQDIVATLWYRAPQLRSPREPLRLGEDAKTLMYRASTGRIVRR